MNTIQMNMVKGIMSGKSSIVMSNLADGIRGFVCSHDDYNFIVSLTYSGINETLRYPIVREIGGCIENVKWH